MTDTGKAYHNQCTGDALQTVQRHAADEDITLFASCFCPFVQRAWVTLEYLGIPYKYYEVDPYKKPKELLDLSPRGLVPALRLNNFDPPRSLNESTVIMDYLEDLASASPSTHPSLFPPKSDPYARALVRLQSDHTNRILVPAFYRFLQAQDRPAQLAAQAEFTTAIHTLVGLFERADALLGNGGTGLWTPEGGTLGWADVMVAPWLLRARVVLKHYRDYDLPQDAPFRAWLDRLLEHPAFKRTCSTQELYIESYERYAFNRPNTSQVANAINDGRGLP